MAETLRETPTMLQRIFIILISFILSFAATTSTAVAEAPSASPLDVSVEWAMLPGGEPLATVVLTPGKGWHFYAHDPGESGKPLQVSAKLAGHDLAVGYLRGTSEPDQAQPELTVNVHATPTPVFVRLPKDAATPLTLRLAMDLLLCTEANCLPMVREWTVDLASVAGLPAAGAQPWAPALEQAVFEDTPAAAVAAPAAAEAVKAPETGQPLRPRFYSSAMEVRDLWKAVALAFLAGFVLNFMPCVLPVVSLKITGLLASGGHESSLLRRRAFLQHNLYFALGVLSYFFGLSLVLSLAGLAWGQIFQSPAVIMVLSALVLALSLSLFGVYDLPIIDLKQGISRTPGQEGGHRAAAFATGLMATLLATPCSGPFLGGVLAWALLQPIQVVTVVFLAIGLGMASPYLLMAARPSLVRFFPRPGVWNQYLEKIVGFFLLGTCIYLLQILPEDRLLQAMVLLWTTAVAAWIWGGLTNLSDSPRRRLLVHGLALAVGLGGLAWALQPPSGPVAFEALAPSKIRQLAGQEAMLVDFTANWCVSCKFLEQTVLTPSRLQRLKDKYGLRLVRVDLTSENPEGMRLLDELGSKSIPVVAIFPKGEKGREPVVLRDLFTAQTLADALAKAF